jgi:glycerol-3-phosphate dehydrogenase (NAD(P)+)
LKNVLAIATGVAAGLGFGYNTQAAIINRGIAEIVRLGNKLGAEPMTFMGLAGMGDLVLTCTGPLSRNRKLGIEIGKGKSFEQVKLEIGGVAEGYYTAKSAYALSQKTKVEMPITDQIYAILYEGASPKAALSELMNRDLKQEW